MTSAARHSAEAGLPTAEAAPPAERCRLAAIDLQKQGRIDDAIRLYRRALALNPSDAAALRCLGTAYKSRKQFAMAAACFQRAVALCPAFPEAWNNLGNTLSEQGDVEGAAECFRRAFTVQPGFAGAHFNFAQAEDKLGRFDVAAAACRRAIELAPRSAEFYNGLGTAEYNAQRIDAALAAYDQAIRINPEFATARYNRSHAWLLLGDYERGWPEYEWRWKLDSVPAPKFEQPRWDGTSLPHGCILLDAEQGLGDTIQFVRYARLVKERVGRVILRCQRPLLALFDAVDGVDARIAKDEPTGPFDVWAPLLSLPLYFTRSLEAIPNAVPYLTARPSLVEFWKMQLENVEGFRVGVHWQGNPAFCKDRFRSIPLNAFEPLAQTPGVQLVSIQKGPACEQLYQPDLTFHVLDLKLSLDEIHGAFLDTAAILKCLDLVVTSDTSVAHLAGALGVETWLAVPHVPEWRWLLDRDDSPWYPTMRLFRQGRTGQWNDVFERMAAQLRPRIAARAA